jgi:hypothetical protein
MHSLGQDIESASSSIDKPRNPFKVAPGHVRLLSGDHSTWRSLLPVVEDRPLALCDSRTVDLKDLVPADRIIPDRVGEVYYLNHNPKHKWSVAYQKI